MSSGVGISMLGRYFRRRGLRTLPEPAYVRDIVQPLQRYREKNTPLSRGYVPPGGWDESLLRTLISVIAENGSLPRNEPGYGQIELAQRIAGFHGAVASNSHTGNWTRTRLTEELGCFYDWEGRWGPGFAGLPWQPEKFPVDEPEAITEIVQDTALFLGASMVGITAINPLWLYQPGWDRYAIRKSTLMRRCRRASDTPSSWPSRPTTTSFATPLQPRPAPQPGWGTRKWPS